jgi:hypothetical protein
MIKILVNIQLRILCLSVSYTYVTYLFTYLLNGAESLLRSYSVCSQSRYYPHFIEPEGSLPHSQVPATCPYPESA